MCVFVARDVFISEEAMFFWEGNISKASILPMEQRIAWGKDNQFRQR